MILQNLLNRPKATEPSSQHRYGIIPRRTAGIVVDEDTALTYSAVYLAVKIISETLAALPSHVYTRKPGSHDKKIAHRHPVQALLMQPNSEMTGYNFKRTLLAHSVLRGNGYAFIDRDRSNRPGELWLITPDLVNKGRSNLTGQIVYEVSNGGAANSYYTDEQMFHLPGLGFDGLTGYSTVALAKRSLALGMAAEQFGASFYENGAQLGTIIEVPPEVNLDEAGRDLLLDSFDKKHKGVKHHHRTALIDQGMKVHSLGIPQKDAQFIESRKFSITDVARWFNLPPHMLKDLDRATFSNIEQQSIEFVQNALMPWVINIEQTINWKLLGRNNTRQFVKLNLNGLLRGDAESRANYFNTMFQMGAYSINEIRAFEDANSIGADGDRHFMQMNMTTIDKVGEEQPAPTPPPVAPPRPNDNQEADQVENLQRFRPLIKNAISHPFRRIDDRLENTATLNHAEKTGFLNDHLERRRDRITAPLADIFEAMTDRPACGVVSFVDRLISTCTNHYLTNTGLGSEITQASLVDEFIVYCGNISATDNG